MKTKRKWIWMIGLALLYIFLVGVCFVGALMLFYWFFEYEPPDPNGEFVKMQERYFIFDPETILDLGLPILDLVTLRTADP